jgi:hypothetical protein
LAFPTLPTLRKFGKGSGEDEDTKDLSEETGGFKDGRKYLHTRCLSLDPDSYLYAKRKLKKAVLEHYRFVTSFFYFCDEYFWLT